MQTEKENRPETREKAGVVVIFEDDATRTEAVKFCDELVHRFWTQYGFEMTWWSFTPLAEARTARDAARKASEADLIVFAVEPDGEIPWEVKGWIENWLSERGDREGALVGLLDPGADSIAVTTDKYVYLREVAHRAGMDYLTQMPQNISRCIPDSLESYSDRADRVTSVLDEILHHVPPRKQVAPSSFAPS